MQAEPAHSISLALFSSNYFLQKGNGSTWPLVRCKSDPSWGPILSLGNGGCPSTFLLPCAARSVLAIDPRFIHFFPFFSLCPHHHVSSGVSDGTMRGTPSFQIEHPRPNGGDGSTLVSTTTTGYINNALRDLPFLPVCPRHDACLCSQPSGTMISFLLLPRRCPLPP